MFYFSQKKKTNVSNFKKRFTKKQIKNNIVNIVVGKSALGKMLRCYVLFVIVGAIFLFLPFSLQHGYWKGGYFDGANWVGTKRYNFFDALFMSTTAFTNTGIVNLNIATTFTTFGKWILLIITQLGGLGFVSILILVWNMFKVKRTSDLETNITLFNERGGGKIGNTGKTIVVSIIFVVIVEFIFTIIYSLWFYYMKAYPTKTISTMQGTFYYDDITKEPLEAYHNTSKAIFWGIFHSVSAINNSGIDIIGANSLAPYRNDEHIFIQICFIIQIILGGIGYPIIYDIYEHISFRIKHKYHKVNLFTKLGLSGYFIITAAGLLFLVIFEYSMKNSLINYLDNNPTYTNSDGTILTNDNDFFNKYKFNKTDVIAEVYGKNPELNKFFAVLFETFTTRSAGFATVNNNTFSQPSLWIITSLMFIGANPSSTGGGIRTVTFIIILIAIFSRFKKNEQVNIFKRKISDQTIYLSFLGTFSVLFLSILFAIIGFACYDNNNYKLFDFFFVCTSAFGTVGLNIMNFDISSYPEIIFLSFLIILMILGQLGISTVLFSPTRLKDKVSSFMYPTEDLKT